MNAKSPPTVRAIRTVKRKRIAYVHVVTVVSILLPPPPPPQLLLRVHSFLPVCRRPLFTDRWTFDRLLPLPPLLRDDTVGVRPDSGRTFARRGDVMGPRITRVIIVCGKRNNIPDFVHVRRARVPTVISRASPPHNANREFRGRTRRFADEAIEKPRHAFHSALFTDIKWVEKKTLATP